MSRITGIAIPCFAFLLSTAAAVPADAAPPHHGAGTAPAADAPVRVVDIRAFAFGPADITVAPGTTVVWNNHDEAPHAIAAGDHSFASKGLDTDDSFRVTFDHPGDFSYVCPLHPFMTGVVHVRAGAGPKGHAAAHGR